MAIQKALGAQGPGQGALNIRAAWLLQDAYGIQAECLARNAHGIRVMRA